MGESQDFNDVTLHVSLGMLRELVRASIFHSSPSVLQYDHNQDDHDYAVTQTPLR
jgi:hypothetical protein